MVYFCQEYPQCLQCVMGRCDVEGWAHPNFITCSCVVCCTMLTSPELDCFFWYRCTLTYRLRGTGIACWLERWTCDQKVASLNPSRSGGRIFFSRVNIVCWLLFGVRSTPVLPQWHVKDPSHSAKSAGGRLHLNTRARLTKRSRYAAVRT